MDKQRIQKLANAIAHWLANKRLSGFGNIFSEALLVIPIAEFLLSAGYKIYAEQDSQKTFDIGGFGNVNYDLVANRQSDKVIFELKFLKKVNNQRLITDFVKLAVSNDKGNFTWSRLLVIAHSDSGKSNSGLINKIGNTKRHTFKVSFMSDIVEVMCDDNIESITGSEKKRIAKILERDTSLKNFVVERSAISNEGNENVVIFSVYR